MKKEKTENLACNYQISWDRCKRVNNNNNNNDTFIIFQQSAQGLVGLNFICTILYAFMLIKANRGWENTPQCEWKHCSTESALIEQCFHGFPIPIEKL